MKKRLLFILCLLFVSASAAQAQQAKTVSNANLEKFRQKRLQAEKEYGENYARLGFPSPAELEKRREEDGKKLSELAARLRREDAERERRESEEEYRSAQYNALLNLSNQNYNRGAYYSGGFYPTYSYGYRNGYSRGYRFPQRRIYGQNGFFYYPRGNFSNFGRRSGVRISVTASGGFGRRR